MKKYSCFFCLLLALVNVFLPLVTVMPVKAEKPAEIMDFAAGDLLTGFEITTIDGEVSNEIFHDKENLLVVYLSEGCFSCIKVLRSLERFAALFSADNLDYLILWKDTIPLRLLEKCNISLNKNFSLNGNARLNKISPAFFLINNKNIVNFASIEFDSMAEKIISDNIISNEMLIENANQYIFTNFLTEPSKKPLLVYFVMEGCPDCIQANNVVDEKEIEDAYTIIRIYRKKDPDDGRILDHFEFFKKIYGVAWFPSFIVLNNEASSYAIIGKTPIEELKETLLKNEP